MKDERSMIKLCKRKQRCQLFQPLNWGSSVCPSFKTKAQKNNHAIEFGVISFCETNFHSIIHSYHKTPSTPQHSTISFSL